MTSAGNRDHGRSDTPRTMAEKVWADHVVAPAQAKATRANPT